MKHRDHTLRIIRLPKTMTLTAGRRAVTINASAIYTRKLHHVKGPPIQATLSSSSHSSAVTSVTFSHVNFQTGSKLAQRRTFFTRIQSVVRTILVGDDFENPKKLLERQYIYLSLLALEYRRLCRLASANSLSTNQLAHDQDKDALYEAAIEKLDERRLDEMSNERLRIELQDAIHPQVVEIIHTFRQVDSKLFPCTNTQLNHSNGLDPFWGMDSGSFIAILEQELADLQDQMATATDSCSPSLTGFLTTKQEAITLLLLFLTRGETQAHRNDPFGNDTSTLAPSSLQLMRKYQTINLVRSACIRRRIGYSILSLRSSIPNAGRGVFVDGSALTGSIVSFQPGDAWPKEHLLTTAPEVMAHFAEEDEHCFISLRFDDFIIDSRQSPVTVLVGNASGCNPWALGHMVNHPLHKTRPNCLTTMIDFSERMFHDLESDAAGECQSHAYMKYLPNAYARQPSWKSRAFYNEPIVMHGLCLVARRDICDEELFYDYRLQSNETPDWYSVADSGIMEQEQVVFFRDD
ncbi:hypothetical protein MPSEU_000287400 [Mayamaea pseudoterrestris]|nr:hypothetical protein MPSEU_000287400 [Mayamaea pseudoterrestris]